MDKSMLASRRRSMSVMAFVSVLIFEIFVLIQVSLSDKMICGVQLDGAAKTAKVNEDCSKTNKMDESKLDDVFLNTTLEEFDVDDNCFIHCVYKGMGALTPDDIIDKKETSNIFKGNMTAAMYKTVTSIWEKCIDDIAKIAKSKPSGNKNHCKPLAQHDFCFNKRMIEAGVHQMEC